MKPALADLSVLYRSLWTLIASERLDTVSFSLTYRCNQACKTCGAWRKGDDFASREMDPAEVCRVIDQLPGLNVKNVILVGSEVLLYEGFFTVLSRLHELDLRVSILTNATLIDEQMSRRILSTEPARLTVSIDGTQETHDGLRGRGTYSRAMQGLQNLDEAKLELCPSTKLGVHMTLSRFNSADVLKVQRLCATRGWAFSVQVAALTTSDQVYGSHLEGAPVASTRFLSRHGFNLRREDHDRLRRANEILGRAGSLSPSLHLTASMPTESLLQGQFPIGVCRTIGREVTIEPDGSVIVCSNTDAYSLGNVRESTLAEIWNSDRRRALKQRVGRRGLPVCRSCCKYPQNLYYRTYFAAGMRYLGLMCKRLKRPVGPMSAAGQPPQ